MSYSAKIKIDKEYPRQDGTSAIFMQVIIHRKKARVDLDLKWPADKFDESNYCKPRRKDDDDVQDFNIIIRDALAKANRIHKTYRLRNQMLSLDLFMREYRTDLNKDDFIQYYAQKSLMRYNKGIISKQTWKNESSTLETLKRFIKDSIKSGEKSTPVLPFHEFVSDWASDFDHYMRKIKNDKNTRWGRHKNVSTYLNMAREKDRITFIDPYENFTNSMVKSKWKPLDLDEMKLLITWYQDWKSNPLPLLKRENGLFKKDLRKGLTAAEVIVLRRFLFMCNCSLRISDSTMLTRDSFKGYEISFTPEKTERYGTEVKSMPLNDVARMLLDDELRDNKGHKIFNRFTAQYSNRILKRIADKIKLETKLHHHVGRYTFASLMDQAGANHTGLMEYMGLKKRETLNKYVKSNLKVISQDIGKLNQLIKTPSL